MEEVKKKGGRGKKMNDEKKFVLLEEW